MRRTITLFALFAIMSTAFAGSPIPSNSLKIGDGTASNKTIIFNKGSGATNPKVRYNNSTSKVQVSHDGSTYKTVNLGTDIDSGAATNGQVPAADGSGGTSYQTISSIVNAQPSANFLINSNFELWQRNTTGGLANTLTDYVPDRWAVTNNSGTNSVITIDRVAGTTQGAQYGARVKVTTAPTAAQAANAYSLTQVLENRDSLPLYNQTASFAIHVKALGNITQVGIQFRYATTEIFPTTGIGSEVLCTVNSSTFSTCSISGQALGTSMTTSGVVGVRIRTTAASSGNDYDLNNGFIAEQATLNVGSTPATWSRAGVSFTNEILMAERFYTKTYDLDVVPGTATTNGVQSAIAMTGGAANQLEGPRFPVRMRSAATLIIYSGNGTLNKVTDSSDIDSLTVDHVEGTGTAGSRAVVLTSTFSAFDHIQYHYTADAEIR